MKKRKKERKEGREKRKNPIYLNFSSPNTTTRNRRVASVKNVMLAKRRNFYRPASRLCKLSCYKGGQSRRLMGGRGWKRFESRLNLNEGLAPPLTPELPGTAARKNKARGSDTFIASS